MTTTTRFSTFRIAVVASFAVGCATVPPTQLVDVRRAWEAANQGLAGQMTPTDLYEARKSLDQANAEFAQNGDTEATRDYAYIAMRKVQLAEATARTAVDRQSIKAAASRGVVVRDAQAVENREALASVRGQLKDERDLSAAAAARATNESQARVLAETSSKFEAERAARLTGEARLAAAMRDLATVASLREEPRGLVITLSGSVLFANNSYTLLETARGRLDQVATALRSQDQQRTMVVEGHTDSSGSTSANRTLSLNRANAVRDYLVSSGVEAARISAVGLGSNRPVLNNVGPENMANNRRVEIVLASMPIGSR